MSQEFFMYRGYPLVRCGNQIYYGYMAEPYVVMIEIKHQTEVIDGMKLADKLKVYQMATREKNPMKAIVKTSDRSTLYDAVDLAHAWLVRVEKDPGSKEKSKRT